MTACANTYRRALAGACLLVALTAIFPAAVPAASTRSPLGLSPATSARLGIKAATTTQAPSTATTTQASGAQPGNVAPGSTTTTPTPSTTAPATTVPPSATAPSATVPTATTPTAATPTTIAPGGSTTAVGVSRKASPGKHLSTGALALAILGALLALGCATWVAGRWMALEPRWSVSTMHSLREASYHASATWAEFSDWARMGR